MDNYKILCTRKELFERYEKKFGASSLSSSSSKKLTKKPKSSDFGLSAKECMKLEHELEHLKQKSGTLGKLNGEKNGSAEAPGGQQVQSSPAYSRIRNVPLSHRIHREGQMNEQSHYTSQFSDYVPFVLFIPLLCVLGE